jgi:hypothetical protein
VYLRKQPGLFGNRRLSDNRRGSVLTLLAICLPVAIVLAAFAMNLSYMELARTELYNTADAAARAANRDYVLSNDITVGLATGKAVALQNVVGGIPHKLKDSDFVFGSGTRTALNQRYGFTLGGLLPNAVQVTAQRKAGSTDGPMSLLLPNLLGISSFQPAQMSQATRTEVDIAVVLDRSGSMVYADTETANAMVLPAAAPPGWNWGQPCPPKARWLDAVAALDIFITELNLSPGTELCSLSTYSSASTLEFNFSSNYSDLDASMATYTNAFPGGTTAIGDGLIQGINTFASGTNRPWASKVILLMTDGIQNTGTDPMAAAQLAADSKIMIFAVSFSAEADQALMDAVATKALGKHFHANTGADLKLVFQTIARNLPTLLTY